MENAEQPQTPNSLVFGRHLGAMALASLMNPLIYYSDRPFTRWVETWAAPLAISAACYAAYALFFTRRAKEAWPRSFFTLAWVFLLLTIAGPYIDKFRNQRTPNVAESKSMAAEVTTTASPAIQSTPVSDPSYGANLTHPPTNNTPATAPLPSPPTTPALDARAQEVAHYRRIYAAHPDADAIFDSPEFHVWLSRNSGYLQTPSSGTTEEIIQMFSAYKATKSALQRSETEEAMRNAPPYQPSNPFSDPNYGRDLLTK